MTPASRAALATLLACSLREDSMNSTNVLRGSSSRPSTRAIAWLVLGLMVTTAACAGRGGGQPPVTEGNARFTVITPTLIRLEYAEDGAFEDRPTQTVGTRPARHTPYTTRVEGGERIVETEALTLRYRVDSGPFGAENLTVTLRQGAAEVVARPAWGREAPNDDQLGGWLRGLDLLGTSAPLNRLLTFRLDPTHSTNHSDGTSPRCR